MTPHPHPNSKKKKTVLSCVVLSGAHNQTFKKHLTHRHTSRTDMGRQAQVQIRTDGHTLAQMYSCTHTDAGMHTLTQTYRCAHRDRHMHTPSFSCISLFSVFAVVVEFL